MNNVNLDITRAIDDPNIQVMILINRTEVVRAFVTADHTFSTTVNWSAPVDQVAQLGADALISKLPPAIKSAINAVKQTTPVTSYITTIKAYVSTTGPTFTLPLFFVALKEDDDIRQNVLKITDLVYPRSVGNTLLTPPGGYLGPVGATRDEPPGLISIRIGRWFDAIRLFLISDASVTFSKEVIPSGNPLYAKMSVTFTPWKSLSANEWRNCFPT